MKKSLLYLFFFSLLFIPLQCKTVINNQNLSNELVVENSIQQKDTNFYGNNWGKE